MKTPSKNIRDLRFKRKMSSFELNENRRLRNETFEVQKYFGIKNYNSSHKETKNPEYD
jgi:hypothetical protein